MVAGNVGGIPLQIVDGESGFLVSTSEECTEKVGWLLANQEQASLMGAQGVEHVRDKFLTTRYLRDYLSICRELGKPAGRATERRAQQVRR